MTDKILVSACLLGRPVRHNGSAKTLEHELIGRWRREGRVVPFCPELAAGFATPRPTAEIVNGGGAEVLSGNARVIEASGRDVTDLFVAGARAALDVARAEGCRLALLTDGSPSCGSASIHDGRFQGAKRRGEGVTATLLRDQGIEVFAEFEIEALAARLARA